MKKPPFCSTIRKLLISYCRYFGIPHDVFAEVRSTSEIYGHIKDGPLAGVPISGVMKFIGYAHQHIRGNEIHTLYTPTY
jgi:hypothetical protein